MHRIRLAGPWEVTPLNPPGPPSRIKLPAEWTEFVPAGVTEVCLRRSFHKPTGLVASDRVFIQFSYEPVSVRLDGDPVGCATKADQKQFGYEITNRLNGFHRLEVELDGPVTTEEPIWLVIVDSDDP